MDIKRILAVVLGPILVLAACTLPPPPTGAPPTVQVTATPFQPAAEATGPVPTNADGQLQPTTTGPAPAGATEQVFTTASDPPPPTVTQPVPPAATEPAPIPSATLGPAMLTLDANYFCNHGPGRNYTDIVDYPAGTVLPIIGSNGAGWWLVRIDDRRTHHTECWIGGGIPSGDMAAVPILPAPGGFVPVHDEALWSSVIYLDCSDLARYRWVWNGAGSGEYVSTAPILGIPRPTIIYDEWNPICPSWSPPEVVKVHDESTWNVIGYLTCAELEEHTWTWNGVSSGEYLAEAGLFGSARPTIYMGEVTPHCPSFSP